MANNFILKMKDINNLIKANNITINYFPFQSYNYSWGYFLEYDLIKSYGNVAKDYQHASYKDQSYLSVKINRSMISKTDQVIF